MDYGVFGQETLNMSKVENTAIHVIHANYYSVSYLHQTMMKKMILDMHACNGALILPDSQTVWETHLCNG